MIITRKNQLLLRFLQLRVVVNGIKIYPLERKKPVVIPLEINKAQIVVTDGYHCTSPYEIVCSRQGYQRISIGCQINNDQLIAGIILIGLFYAASLTSGLLFLKIISFIPIIIFILLFYIKPKDFLKLEYE